MKDNMYNKKILFLPPQQLPVPATGGGAIETLLTSLIYQNEREQLADFLVISKYDKNAVNFAFSHTTIFYFENGKCVTKPFNKKIIKIKYYVYVASRIILQKMFANRITIKIFKNNIQYLNFFMFQVSYIAKKQNVNCIINESFSKTINQFEIMKKLIKCRLFFHAHYVDTPPENFGSCYSLLLGISDFVTKTWSSTTNFLYTKTLYNGIRQFKKTSDNILKSTKKTLGIKEDDFVILYVGRIIKEKGVKELIQAFNFVDNNKFKMIVIGTPNFSLADSSQYYDDVMSIIKNNSNILYLGYIHNDLLSVYYEIADIQVVPSIWEEGAGLVALEGMSAGLPLIITRSGGMIEYVDDKCALIVERDDNLPRTIADKITFLYLNEKIRSKMSDNCKERAKVFSTEKMYNNFVGIIDECITE